MSLLHDLNGHIRPIQEKKTRLVGGLVKVAMTNFTRLRLLPLPLNHVLQQQQTVYRTDRLDQS